MITVQMAVDGRLFAAVCIGLFFFGWAFNALVEKLDGKKDGYTALLVVAGVIVTLCGAAFISWQAALLVGALFVPAGIPMIIGDISRAIKAREIALQALRDGRNEQA